jgi:hypothetical protein
MKPTKYEQSQFEWISCMEVRHWRSLKMIRRKDGLPFRFRVRRRK